jgi:hypothetical protein
MAIGKPQFVASFRFFAATRLACKLTLQTAKRRGYEAVPFLPQGFAALGSWPGDERGRIDDWLLET